MHSRIAKTDACGFKRRYILNFHGNLDRACQGIIESMLMKKFMDLKALLIPTLQEQIFFRNHCDMGTMRGKILLTQHDIENDFLKHIASLI